MKNLIIAALVAASVSVAGVANAQVIDSVSPYVGFKYVVEPGDVEGAWFGGKRRSQLDIGTEAALPWGVTADASVRFRNRTTNTDTQAFDLGGFNYHRSSITLSKEVMDGLDVYTNTKFDEEFDRKSTSIGALWKF